MAIGRNLGIWARIAGGSVSHYWRRVSDLDVPIRLYRSPCGLRTYVEPKPPAAGRHCRNCEKALERRIRINAYRDRFR